MDFDVNKLKEINDLDFEQVAIWPKEIKIVVGFVCAIIVSAICYYAIISSKLPILEGAKNKETELRSTFEAKYRVAVNLNAYIEQLERIEQDFSSMLKSLPNSNETPGLLDDVTFVGTDAGLSFKLLNWQQEIPKEFYTELPIQLEVAGSYHEFGQFASNVANLPRIVTLHDFDINVAGDSLVLTMQARTYRAEATEQ
ncbi:type 4a pilus biogenesis protein PilO [Glaciecola petra]|uniref:Type 4a pilus biogenesis protein PilO n=1 Tax=Glaciecola petra TaxID=3075602 RepID=A0ABU2ZSB6_9ALTE|nr:type 4a pilus biogenesis protein PilO [Aestuariibacter sp. P117]MDT0595528.1 type 4a pilus biogenesis protein PilO [Aestuariibacter sp. P117]